MNELDREGITTMRHGFDDDPTPPLLYTCEILMEQPGASAQDAAERMIRAIQDSDVTWEVVVTCQEKPYDVSMIDVEVDRA